MWVTLEDGRSFNLDDLRSMEIANDRNGPSMLVALTKVADDKPKVLPLNVHQGPAAECEYVRTVLTTRAKEAATDLRVVLDSYRRSQKKA